MVFKQLNQFTEWALWVILVKSRLWRPYIIKPWAGQVDYCFYENLLDHRFRWYDAFSLNFQWFGEFIWNLKAMFFKLHAREAKRASRSLGPLAQWEACTNLYKAKILAKKLKEVIEIVSFESWDAFVKGWKILDTILNVQTWK